MFRRTFLLLGAFLVGASLILARLPAGHADVTPQVVPPPALDLPAGTGPEVATLSGGCFWGIQGIFEHVRGVQRAVSGYAGGPADTANYRSVSTGSTGHAETVQITYDAAQISYGQILQIFFSVGLDPTEVDRQGPDDGTQYRSEVWAANPDQAKVARAYIAQLDAAHVWRQPIATRVDPLVGFYPAEDYHQDFLVRHPDQPYIAFYDIPKVQALARLFPEAWRTDPGDPGGDEVAMATQEDVLAPSAHRLQSTCQPHSNNCCSRIHTLHVSVAEVALDDPVDIEAQHPQHVPVDAQRIGPEDIIRCRISGISVETRYLVLRLDEVSVYDDRPA